MEALGPPAHEVKRFSLVLLVTKDFMDYEVAWDPSFTPAERQGVADAVRGLLLRAQCADVRADGVLKR